MKRIITLFCLTLALHGCKDDENRVVIESVTPEGRPFHFMPIYEDGVTDITLMVAWPSNWAYRADKNPAVPYIAAETILSGGTSSLKPQEVMEIFNDNNADGQLFPQTEYVIGRIDFPKEHIKETIDIAGEMIKTPQLDPAWVNRIKGGMLSGILESQARSNTQAWIAMRFAILGDHPVIHFLDLPNPDQIDAVNRDLLMNWQRETLTNAPEKIVVTGAISAKKAGKFIDRLLSPLPPPLQTVEGENAKGEILPKTIYLHRPEAEKTTLILAGKLPSLRDGGEFRDLLALNIFGQGLDSPLAKAIRTELRASYGLQAGYHQVTPEQRFLFITGEVETALLAQSVKTVKTAYEDYRSNPDFTGFEELQSVFQSNLSDQVKSVSGSASTILSLVLNDLDPTITPNFGNEITKIDQNTLKDHILSDFPPAAQFMVIATGPDASALPNACVITNAIDAAQCP